MKVTYFPPLFLFLLKGGCSSLILKLSDFDWPVESALNVDGRWKIQSDRYSFSINVKELLFAETQDSINVSKVLLRIIRDVKGFYFITASHFKNV